MAEIIGRQIAAGIGVEDVRGTAPTTPDRWFRAVTASIVERAERATDDTKRGRLEDSEGARIVRKWVEGSLEGIVHADAIGFLFYNLYGAVNSQVVTGSIYDHVFTLQNSIQHPSLSVFAYDGGVQNLVYRNGMVSSLELTVTTDDYVRFSAEFIAKDSASNADSPSYATEYDFISRDVTMKIADTEGGLSGATALKVKEMNISWTAEAIADYVFGSYNPDDVYNSSFMIEGQMTLNYEDNTFKDLYLADTYKYMQIVIEGAADIGSGNHPTITILFNRVQFNDWNREGGNDELVTQPVSFKAFLNVTDSQQSEVTLRNLMASYSNPVSA